MPQEDPLDEALFVIEKLISFLEKNVYSMVNTQDLANIESQLNMLEQKIGNFASDSESGLRDAGLEKKDLILMKDGKIPENVTGEQKETIQKAERLKQRLRDLQEIVAQEKGPQEKALKKKVDKKKLTERERRKKFKRLGGTDDWKPL